MKNFLISSIIFAAPAFALASTVYFSPSSISLRPGQVVSINIIVDPQGQSAYTSKVSVSFPASLLNVSSFSQASGWLPLTQPGYDSTDNTSGVITKTAGYAGGITRATNFGTITFIARVSGTATISINGNTQILNSSSANTFSGGGSATITIAAPLQAPVVVPRVQTPTNTKSKNSPARLPLSSPTTTLATSSALTATTSSTEALAARSVVKTPALTWAIIIPLLTFIAGLFLGRLSKKV